MAGQSKDMNETEKLMNFRGSRRDFLKAVSAVTAGGVALSFPTISKAAALSTQSFSGTGTWREVREQFLLGDLIYMNTGTEGSIPETVLDSFAAYTKLFTSNPWNAINNDTNLNIFQVLNRQKAADFLGAPSYENIVLTNNTTWGLNAVVHGLDLQAGDTVITTTHENGAATSPLQLDQDRKGIIVKEIALPTPAVSAQGIVDAFQAAIKTSVNVKALIFSHINYTTGLRMPVKALCALASSYGLITIVDGAHAPGMINFSLTDLGCDYYPCAGHKWLCAPPGTGMLYLRPGTDNGMLPSAGKFPTTPSSPNLNDVWPMLTEAYEYLNITYPGLDTSIGGILQIRGQLNTPAFAAMSDAMDFQTAIGKQKIEDRDIAMSRYLRQQIAATWGANSLLAPAADAPQEIMSGIAGFNPFRDWTDATKPAAVQSTLLSKYNIVIRTLSFNPIPGNSLTWNALRASTHLYNDFSQIDALISAMKAIIKTL